MAGYTRTVNHWHWCTSHCAERDRRCVHESVGARADAPHRAPNARLQQQSSRTSVTTRRGVEHGTRDAAEAYRCWQLPCLHRRRSRCTHSLVTDGAKACAIQLYSWMQLPGGARGMYGDDRGGRRSMPHAVRGQPAATQAALRTLCATHGAAAARTRRPPSSLVGARARRHIGSADSENEVSEHSAQHQVMP